MDFNLYRNLNQALNWLLPHTCVACTKTLSENKAFCNACFNELPFQSRSCCVQCGQAFAANKQQCGHCLVKPPHFNSCFCPFEYQTPIKELICALKYQEKPSYAQKIGQLLANEILASGLPMPEYIIPVPMHIQRLRVRGFNQAKLIADHVGLALNIPVLASTIIKNKASPPQAQQNLKNRKKTLKGCFHMNKKLRAESVAIIDDVVTTGSTVNEIAKILKKNGVDYIQVWGVAHTL